MPLEVSMPPELINQVNYTDFRDRAEDYFRFAVGNSGVSIGPNMRNIEFRNINIAIEYFTKIPKADNLINKACSARCANRLHPGLNVDSYLEMWIARRIAPNVASSKLTTHTTSRSRSGGQLSRAASQRRALSSMATRRMYPVGARRRHVLPKQPGNDALLRPAQDSVQGKE
nr:hypothetical protein [Tanacetum cinerariifolium]